MIRWNPTVCPTCDRILPGLGTYCEDCGAYTEDMVGATTDTTPEKRARAVADTRTEDERKRDARPVIEAMGWTVYDHEQGWRRDTCVGCGTKIPGGHSTRVPRGWPDWVVTGHGHVVFLEWKTDTNSLSAHQKDVAAQMAVDGVPYFVVRNTEDALKALATVRIA